MTPWRDKFCWDKYKSCECSNALSECGDGLAEDAVHQLLFLREIRELNLTHPRWVQFTRVVEPALLQQLVAAAHSPAFTRRLADVQEDRKRPPKNPALRFVLDAYLRLTQDPHHDPREVTKKKVKVLALELWACANLVKRGILSHPYRTE